MVTLFWLNLSGSVCKVTSHGIVLFLMSVSVCSRYGLCWWIIGVIGFFGRKCGWFGWNGSNTSMRKSYRIAPNPTNTAHIDSTRFICRNRRINNCMASAMG